MYRTLLLLLMVLKFYFVNAQNHNSDFFKSCKENNVSKVKEFLKKGINLELKDEDGNTALMYASRPFNFEIIKLLVENGAKLNEINNEGKTALTLVRTRPWEIYDSEMDESIWKIYSYLESKGAREQDYVDFIAKNISGKHASEQKKILEIKQNYADYHKNIKSYKLKQFHSEERAGDEIIYSHRIFDHQARYDLNGKLVYFGYTHNFESEWHDNGARENTKEEYYLKDDKIYFHLYEYSYGYNPIKEQYRTYLADGKIVIRAYKSIANHYGKLPEWMKDFQDLVNIKAPDEPKQSVAEFEENFKRIYNDVKDNLK